MLEVTPPISEAEASASAPQIDLGPTDPEPAPASPLSAEAVTEKLTLMAKAFMQKGTPTDSAVDTLTAITALKNAGKYQEALEMMRSLTEPEPNPVVAQPEEVPLPTELSLTVPEQLIELTLAEKLRLISEKKVEFPIWHEYSIRHRAINVALNQHDPDKARELMKELEAYYEAQNGKPLFPKKTESKPEQTVAEVKVAESTRSPIIERLSQPDWDDSKLTLKEAGMKRDILSLANLNPLLASRYMRVLESMVKGRIEFQQQEEERQQMLVQMAEGMDSDIKGVEVISDAKPRDVLVFDNMAKENLDQEGAVSDEVVKEPEILQDTDRSQIHELVALDPLIEQIDGASEQIYLPEEGDAGFDIPIQDYGAVVQPATSSGVLGEAGDEHHEDTQLREVEERQVREAEELRLEEARARFDEFKRAYGIKLVFETSPETFEPLNPVHVDDFIREYFKINDVPPSVELSQSQKEAVIRRIIQMGMSFKDVNMIYDGTHHPDMDTMALKITPNWLDLPAGVPQPVMVTENGNQRTIKYNFPFKLFNRATLLTPERFTGSNNYFDELRPEMLTYYRYKGLDTVDDDPLAGGMHVRSRSVYIKNAGRLRAVIFDAGESTLEIGQFTDNLTKNRFDLKGPKSRLILPLVLGGDNIVIDSEGGTLVLYGEQSITIRDLRCRNKSLAEIIAENK